MVDPWESLREIYEEEEKEWELERIMGSEGYQNTCCEERHNSYIYIHVHLYAYAYVHTSAIFLHFDF